VSSNSSRHYAHEKPKQFIELKLNLLNIPTQFIELMLSLPNIPTQFIEFKLSLPNNPTQLIELKLSPPQRARPNNSRKGLFQVITRSLFG